MNRHITIQWRKTCRGFSQGLLATLALCLIAAGGATWVGMGMLTQDQWPVKWLEVDGVFERVSAEQIRASLVPVTAGSFFTVDQGAIREAAHRHPWIETVKVQKAWPDTVKVHISEYTPVAHWTGDRLISNSGEPFEVSGAADIQGLPYLEGPDDQLGLVFSNWTEINNELMPTGMEIELIRLDPRGSWFLELNNGTEVHLGREEARPRLRMLISSWDGLMKGRDLAPMVVDLRYTNGFAVRWPEPPARFAGTHGKEN